MLNNDRRIALVIGNSAYKNADTLPNPERDANLVADALKRTGFETVTLLTNLRKDALVSALRDFAARAETADWAVVYYAGHGMEVGGINYLIPTDAKIAADRDIGFEAVPLEQVLNAAERAKKLRLVILDACRVNPFASQMKRTQTVASRSVSRGLAAVEPEAGTLVVYAAKDGETALDGDGINSPFASALVKNLPTPGLEVRRLFDFVRDDVMEATGRKQKPFSYGSISGRQDFYFVAGDGNVASRVVFPPLHQNGSPPSVANVSATALGPPMAANGGGYLVHVTSQKNEADVLASYRTLQSKFPTVLGSRSLGIDASISAKRAFIIAPWSVPSAPPKRPPSSAVI